MFVLKNVLQLHLLDQDLRFIDFFGSMAIIQPLRKIYEENPTVLIRKVN